MYELAATLRWDRLQPIIKVQPTKPSYFSNLADDQKKMALVVQVVISKHVLPGQLLRSSPKRSRGRILVSKGYRVRVSHVSVNPSCRVSRWTKS